MTYIYTSTNNRTYTDTEWRTAPTSTVEISSPIYVSTNTPEYAWWGPTGPSIVADEEAEILTIPELPEGFDELCRMAEQEDVPEDEDILEVVWL